MTRTAAIWRLDWGRVVSFQGGSFTWRAMVLAVNERPQFLSTQVSLECCSTWGLVPPKESDPKEQGRSCDNFYDLRNHRPSFPQYHAGYTGSALSIVEEDPAQTWQQNAKTIGGHLVTAHDTFHQDVEFFFDQFEPGLACECSDQLSTVKMMLCQFQVESFRETGSFDSLLEPWAIV